MSKCNKCKVDIIDNTTICPLCQCVLEPNDTEYEDVYPDVKVREKRLALAIRIYFFVAVVAETILLYVNYHHQNGYWWSAITAGAFAYIYLIMKIGVQNDSGYRKKIIWLTACGVAFIYVIDRVIGYSGWSLNYVLPSSVLMLNVAIILLMIVNWRNWPSYLLFQMACIVLSLIPIGLWRLHYITRPLLSEIALAVSVFLFLGTMIIGGNRARIELKRRFHV